MTDPKTTLKATPRPRFEELRVKVRSLAEEARIIRHEELRAKRRGAHAIRERLYLHRIHVVRLESRASQLAAAYLRGKPRASCEQHGLTHRDKEVLPRLLNNVRNFGVALHQEWRPDVHSWFLGGDVILDGTQPSVVAWVVKA